MTIAAQMCSGTLANSGTVEMMLSPPPRKRGGEGNKEEGFGLHVFSSVVAAFLSSTLSVPADVVLTRYQASTEMGRSYPGGVLQCATVLYRESGVLGFFRGWVPLFMRVAPLYVCYLPLYEQLRRALGLGYLD